MSRDPTAPGQGPDKRGRCAGTIPAEEDIAVLRIEVAELLLRQPCELLTLEHETLHAIQVLVPLLHQLLGLQVTATGELELVPPHWAGTHTRALYNHMGGGGVLSVPPHPIAQVPPPPQLAPLAAAVAGTAQ